MSLNTPEQWMALAIQQAKKAELRFEVPVGAVIVQNNTLLVEGHNSNISKNDATMHAEIDVIRKAGMVLNNYRLIDCDLYVTLEPCMMCLGAIIHSRINKLYYGAPDPKTGALGGYIDLTKHYIANHKVEATGGILEHECSMLLKNFFMARR